MGQLFHGDGEGARKKHESGYREKTRNVLQSGED